MLDDFKEAANLEHEHLSQAPLPTLTEQALAEQIGVGMEGERLTWEPGVLPTVCEHVPAGAPRAIYGRGPVWLAAMLATHALPAPAALFDARYGWILLPEVVIDSSGDVNVQVHTFASQGFDWLAIQLPTRVIDPDDTVRWPEVTLNPHHGIVLSGKLPRWLFAALARNLAPTHPWIAINEPRLKRLVIVYSQIADAAVGHVIPTPAEALGL